MSSFTDWENRHPQCPSEECFSNTRIFPVIHALREDIVENIDSALTWEQLVASDVNFAVIRPLVLKYAALENLATVYSCFIVRHHFLKLSDEDLAHSSLNNSRAMLCELLAIKFLRHFANDRIQLVTVLTHNWNPLAGAPLNIVDDIKRKLSLWRSEELTESTSALEMAISTNAKCFISTTLTQAVVNDIWSGRIVFTTVSNHSLVADNYKQRQIGYYDVRETPFLDHYRLRVPKYRSILEMVNFAILLTLFILCLWRGFISDFEIRQSIIYLEKKLHTVTIWEQMFILFYVAFALDEYTASIEHGWKIYMANMWNVFDASFILVGLIYLVLRIKGLVGHNDWYNEFAFDVLACGACILFPRIAFFAVSNNVVVLALRGMIAEFIFFMTIAVICFSGLLFTLWELAQLAEGNRWTVKSIAWLMTQVWFGNTPLTFQQAESFHPFFGPILMVMFAALSNTLLLTILISILSNTFAEIHANAKEEHLFQFTLSTIEGVKSDALFSYQPPLNLLAYLILAPMSRLVSPRMLHTINVFLIRVTSFPILVIIAVYERYITAGPNFRQKSSNAAHSLVNSLPRKMKTVVMLEPLVGSKTRDLYEAIFEVDVAGMALFPITEEDEHHDLVRLRDFPSRETLNRHQGNSRHPHLSHTAVSSPSSPKLSPLLPPSTPPFNVLSLRSPSPSRPRLQSLEGEQQASPLAKIYLRRPLSMVDVREGSEPQEHIFQDILGKINRIEHALENLNDLSIGRLRSEMKDLQERQTRIETLLLTLTRGLRGETTVSKGGVSTR